MIPGTTVTLLDGKEYLVPPLTWQQAYDLSAHTDLVFSTQFLAASRAALTACLVVTLAALQRNYPDMTEDDLIPLLDIPCCLSLFGAAMTTRPSASAEPVFMMPPSGTLAN